MPMSVRYPLCVPIRNPPHHPVTHHQHTGTIDPEADGTRNHLLEDLLIPEHVAATGHVRETGGASHAGPRDTLTGDPDLMDGPRAVIVVPEEVVPFPDVDILPLEPLGE